MLDYKFSETNFIWKKFKIQQKNSCELKNSVKNFTKKSNQKSDLIFFKKFEFKFFEEIFF